MYHQAMRFHLSLRFLVSVGALAAVTAVLALAPAPVAGQPLTPAAKTAKTWTKPWRIAFPLKQEPNYQLYEYACHEGNYAMMNLLSGARAGEKAAAEEAAKNGK